ncbi:MAG: gamma-glutamyltransferase, partial [Deltaproteobacteria bacterium]
KFMDMDLVSAPPPSAGGVLILQMLKVLEGFPLKDISQRTPEYVHLLSEVMKRAYADRSQFVGDPEFILQDFSKLISEPYIEALRKNISLEKATPSAQIKGGQFLDDKTHTTHLSVMDVDGNAVASTLTINDTFGACVIAPGTGVFLNDEMDDLSAKPGVANIYGLTGDTANEIRPLKRPASSMSPTIILKQGQPILVAGAAGGSRITTSVLQVLLNDLIVYSGNLKKAIFAPRIHQQWTPESLDLEEGYSDLTRGHLESIGEKIRKAPWSAITQATHLEQDGKVRAVFDPRDEGGAEAY